MFVTLLMAIFTLVIDVITKTTVMARMLEGEAIPIIKGVLTLHYIRNPGAAYGLLTGHRWLLVVISILVIMGILWYVSQTKSVLEHVALGFILGGAVGNLINRIIWGSVIDLIEINPLTTFFQVFNLADVAIVSGVTLLFWTILKKSIKSESAKN